ANARILRGVAERLGVTLAAFRMNVERYGNTGAASIPILLAEADVAGHLVPGDLIGLTAAGAGPTWGGASRPWRRACGRARPAPAGSRASSRPTTHSPRAGRGRSRRTSSRP